MFLFQAGAFRSGAQIAKRVRACKLRQAWI